MLQRALLIGDDFAPNEGIAHYMQLSANWSQRRASATLLKIDIMSCRLHGRDVQSLEPDEFQRGELCIHDTSNVWPYLRLRTNGGHSPAFSQHWSFITRTAKETGFPLPDDFDRHGAGDWHPTLDRELKNGEIVRKPFRFTRADAKRYPAMYDVLRRGFDIARASEPRHACYIESFPVGTPFRRIMIQRNPNRHRASSEDGFDI